MKLSFSNIINRHKNMPAIVCGHGPSLNNDRENIIKLQLAKKIIRFDCNEWYDFIGNLYPDYWVLASPADSIPFYLNKINDMKITTLYADSIDLTDRDWVERNLKVDYLGYDQKHHHGNVCSCFKNKLAYCCKYIVPGRLTIQEELSKYCKCNAIYSAYSVASHMIAFAVLMGCNPVYVSGLDLSYSKGYANPSISIPPFELDRNGIIKNDFTVINNAAKKISTKILQLNRRSTYDVFVKGNFDGL